MCVCVCVCVFTQSLNHVQLFALPWRLQPARLLCPRNFPLAGNKDGLPFPTPGDLPDPGIKSTYLASPALADGFFTLAPPRKPYRNLAHMHAKSIQSCLTWRSYGP